MVVSYTFALAQQLQFFFKNSILWENMEQKNHGHHPIWVSFYYSLFLWFYWFFFVLYFQTPVATAQHGAGVTAGAGTEYVQAYAVKVIIEWVLSPFMWISQLPDFTQTPPSRPSRFACIVDGHIHSGQLLSNQLSVHHHFASSSHPVNWWILNVSNPDGAWSFQFKRGENPIMKKTQYNWSVGMYRNTPLPPFK